MKKLFTLIVLAAIGFGAWFSWRAYYGEGHVKITNFVVGGAVAGYPAIWLGLEFHSIPEGVNPTDIKVVFTGQPLVKDKTEFDWAYIVQNAQVSKGDFKGRKPAEGLSPTEPPKLNYPIDISFPLAFKRKVDLSGVMDLMTVQAEVYWGDRKQDTSHTGADHWYSRQAK
jgi:hypothetical protein